MGHARRRVFLGLRNTASYLSGLEAGFRQIGCETEFLSLDDNPFVRSFEREPSRFSRLVREAWLRSKNRPNWLNKRIYRFLLRLYFLYCLLLCDLFVFTTGRTFFFPTDLRILRLFGKTTILVFLGSDSRPCFMNGIWSGSPELYPPARAISHSRSVRDRLVKCSKLTTAIIDSPAAGQMHARPFFSHNTVGFPNALAAGVSPALPNSDAGDGGQTTRAVRILHAPSREMTKGTALIEAMIETLRREGLSIDFVPIRNMPNAVVLRELAECDFVIDQCFSDVPLAGFAGEAAAFGKPAVVGSYASDEFRRFSHDAGLPTSFMVRPEEMIEAVRKLITDPELRYLSGKSARTFVETSWSASSVARRFLAIADGTAPAEWLIDPCKIEYWQGGGAHEEQTRAYIRKMVEIGSPSVLDCLANPSLRQKILCEISWSAEGER